ncbi:hypothetical protein [Aquicoccus sp.]|uniref:hypothetical protein n=1 Tax=Aquicoccus sp. TaxID=2055851 RepID=UPI003568DC29
MNRVLYIPLRLACDLGSIASRMVNAIVFNGSTAQTLSARAYLEGRDSRFWFRMGKIINAVFRVFQEYHIRWAWEQEVERARYVLQRLEGMR